MARQDGCALDELRVVAERDRLDSPGLRHATNAQPGRRPARREIVISFDQHQVESVVFFAPAMKSCERGRRVRFSRMEEIAQEDHSRRAAVHRSADLGGPGCRWSSPAARAHRARGMWPPCRSAHRQARASGARSRRPHAAEAVPTCHRRVPPSAASPASASKGSQRRHGVAACAQHRDQAVGAGEVQ